jgi:arsenate reductase-like glutaredoxin family protein
MPARMANATLFWKSTCTSCRSARAFVRKLRPGSRGDTPHPAVAERNYAKEPLTRQELESIIEAAGSVAELVNMRHAAAKQNGWKLRPPSRSTFIKAALEDANVLRRPIVVRGSESVIGNDEAAIRKLLG